MDILAVDVTARAVVAILSIDEAVAFTGATIASLAAGVSLPTDKAQAVLSRVATADTDSMRSAATAIDTMRSLAR